MTAIAPQKPSVVVGELRMVGVSFSNLLAEGESLTGTPVVEELVTDDLNLANKSVSTVALEINGISVPAGEAVLFSIEGVQNHSDYTIKITVSTDATVPQTLIGCVQLNGIGCV